jgi:hypothetical protein
MNAVDGGVTCRTVIVAFVFVFNRFSNFRWRMAIFSWQNNCFRFRVALVPNIDTIVRLVRGVFIDIHRIGTVDDRRRGSDAVGRVCFSTLNTINVHGKPTRRRGGPYSDNSRTVLHIHRIYPECRLVQHIFGSPFAGRHFGGIVVEGQGGSSVSYSCSD